MANLLSIWRGAVISSTLQGCFNSTLAAGSKCSQYCCKDIRNLPFDISSVRIHTNFHPLSNRVAISTRKSCVMVYCSSTSRVAGLKKGALKRKEGVTKRRHNGQTGSSSKSRGQPGIRGHNENEGKATTSLPFSSSESSEPAVVSARRVQDGFAGLLALKLQLEQERPRKSRLNLRETAQQKDAEGQTEQQPVRSRFMKPMPALEGEEDAGPTKRKLRTESNFTILVQNLATQVTPKEFRSAMMSVAKITRWKYLFNKEGQCRGYGYCQVQTEGDVAIAIQALSKTVLHGKKIKASLYDNADEIVHLESQKDEDSQLDTLNSKRTSSSARLQADPSNTSTGILLSPETNTREGPQRSSVDLDQVNLTFDDENSGAVDLPERTNRDSAVVYESPDDGRISGRSVMEALQRAAALEVGRTKPKKRKNKLASGTRKLSSDRDDEKQSSKQVSIPPLVFKSKWASQIIELETELEKLRQLLY